VVVTWTRWEETTVLPICIHITVGAGSPSISQQNLAVSPSETVRDWGLVRILAGREGFTLWTDTSSVTVAVDDLSLDSEVVRFPVRENLPEE